MWWDYLTSGAMFHYGQPSTWQGLLPAFVSNLFRNTYFVRPTVGLFYDLQMLVFGGEFWAWYVVKWAARLASVVLAWRILAALGAGVWARTLVASLLLFHTASFQLMLHAPDGWSALGILGQLALLAAHKDDLFNLGKLSGSRYIAWLVLAFFTLGTKEAVFAFEVTLLLAMTLRSGNAWRRLIVPYLLLALWVWRLAAASGRTSGLTASLWLSNFRGHAAMLAPDSPFYVLDFLFTGFLVSAFVFLWRQRTRPEGWLGAVCLVSAAGSLAMSSVLSQPALRYVISPLHLLAIPIGLSLPRRFAVVLPLLATVYPVLTANKVYQQELAYQQVSYETSEVIHRMEEYAQRGYGLAVTGLPQDLGGEAETSVRLYFDRSVPGWAVPLPAREVRQLQPGRMAATPRVVLSRLRPAEMVATGLLEAARIHHIEVPARGQYGVLGKLSRVYGRFSHALRENGHVILVDVGAPVPSDSPAYLLYVLEATGPEPSRFLRQDDGTGQVRLGAFLDCPAPMPELIVSVQAGTVRVSLRDDTGVDRWNAQLPANVATYHLDHIPCVKSDGLRTFSLVLDNQLPGTPLHFTVEKCQWDGHIPVEHLLPFRRHGAFGL